MFNLKRKTHTHRTKCNNQAILDILFHRTKRLGSKFLLILLSDADGHVGCQNGCG